MPSGLRRLGSLNPNPSPLAPFPRARRLLTVLAATLALAAPAFAQSGPDPTCPGSGTAPTPTAVAVEAVPIEVASTTADYFVLYVQHDVDGETLELPVLVKRGQDGTTTLAENVKALPKERYRVEQYRVAAPADVDGDCIDDLTELDTAGMNPVNSAAAIALTDGTLTVPDRDTFDALAYNGGGGKRLVKFLISDRDTDRPRIYFMNTKTHSLHTSFLGAVGIKAGEGLIAGLITYDPELVAPDGSQGVYHYWPFPWLAFSYYSFSVVARSYTALAAGMPLLTDNLALYIDNAALPHVQSDLPSYRASRLNLVFDDSSPDFVALNPGEGYGLLRALDPDERPGPRDVVLYEALPNTLPRVAGIITTVPQTPLSHVNLRAVQDGVPNAFIRDALDDPNIKDLIGKYVRYTVTEAGWQLTEATPAEVAAHHAASRPAWEQAPQRDLSVRAITPLRDIYFGHWTAFGVKAANVAVLGRLRFPPGTVPDGFAIPFFFYDTFLQEAVLSEETVLGKKSAPATDKITLPADTTLIAAVTAMLAHPQFQTDFAIRAEMLDDLRDAIKDAESPQWIIDALTAMHATWPEGQSLRYRSSTNNEDLPGFNGAGLYDSYTQKPDETVEDGIDKSLKQVFASLWNLRAFAEREFHRIDHLAAAMGVLVHPNYTDELANGVAVSFDPILGTAGNYYVNTQIGEDLVTNPEALSVPEELLLRPSGSNPIGTICGQPETRWNCNLRLVGSYTVLATSNQVPPGQLLMTDAQLTQLRQHLAVIHARFAARYTPAPDEPFAMEIEFKITSDNILAIKQARPWVFPTDPRQSRTARAIAEHTPAGATIGPPVVATLADNAPLTYTLAGADGAFFAIDAGTGQLRTKAALDHETRATYVVTVTATAPSSTAATNTVTITVTDENEPPVVSGDAAVDYTEGGRGVVAHYTAFDPEGDSLTWTLAGPDSSVLALAADGVLTFQTSPAFATPADADRDNVYQVTVQASDGTLTGTRDVTITVAANAPPVVSGPDAVDYTEGAPGVVAHYTAFDPEGDSLTWTLAGPDSSAFALAADGALTFHTPPTYAAPTDADGDNVYVVTVQASDGTHTGTRAVTITVTERINTGGGGSGGRGGGVGRSGGGGSGGGGPPRIRDQHGNTPAQASALALAAPRFTASTPGQINPASDVDYFTLRVSQAGVVVVETTGATATRGTVWQDGQELATAASGGAGRNFRLGVPVQAGPVVIAVAGNGNQTGAYTLRISLLVGFLENPGPASFQSGLGVISGWVCEAERIDILFDPGTEAEVRVQAAYGTDRADTADTCGDTDNGFGLLVNWNLLGAGEHTVVALADGVELDRATVTVTTVGEGEAEEFLEGVGGECMVEDFPAAGQTVRLVWQQANQNFVIAGENAPDREHTAGADALEGHLENPGPGSFQSGLGVISGWVCEAERIDIVFNPETEAEGSVQAAYGTDRADTVDACGDTNNGFGLLVNWNLLGAGEHTVMALADGVELGRAAVLVTTVGEGAAEEFLEGVAGECVVEDFPAAGQTVLLVWQQRLQNFMIAPPEP